MANLSILEAVITSAVLAGLYVSLLYLLPESIRKLPRDDPIHIAARTGAVFIAGALAVLPLFTLVQDGFENTSTWKLLGYGMACIGSSRFTWAPVAAVLVLFIGPLLQLTLNLMDAPFVKKDDDRPLSRLRQQFTPVMFRNVIVAPLSEEWNFRACVLPLFAMAGQGPWVSIPATCGVFALAHAHHYFEHRRQGYSPAQAALRIAVQLSYTSLFGAYAGWVFWRTGSVIVTTACHALCNWFGLPDVGFLSPRHPHYVLRFVLAASYMLGIIGFVYVLSTSGTWGGREQFPCAVAFGMP